MLSTYNRTKWLVGDAGLCAVSLGTAPTAEHKRGYLSLASSFGCSEDPESGFDALKIKQLPPNFGFKEVELRGRQCFLLSSDIVEAEKLVGCELTLPDYDLPKYTEGAWDENNFALLSCGEDIGKLADLAEHFANLEVLSGSFVWQLCDEIYGLTFAVAQNLSQAVVGDAIEGCKRYRILEESGILDRLDRASRKLHRSTFYSKYLTSTRWADEANLKVEAFVAPVDQSKYRAGWFSLEHLEAWVRNEGPIVKLL